MKADARAVRARLRPAPIPPPPPLPQAIPEIKPKPRVVYLVVTIYDDDYADMLNGWTGDLVERATPKSRRASIEDIQRLVARHYKIGRRDLLSFRRTADIVRPRQIAMYLARILTLRSLPEIARMFSNRDHTTVLNAVKKVERRMNADAVLAATIAEFVRQIEAWAVPDSGG